MIYGDLEVAKLSSQLSILSSIEAVMIRWW